jgi:multiple sugar transport system ATP-binding protein
VLGSQRLPFPGTPSGMLRGRVGPVTVGVRPEHLADAATVPDPPPGTGILRATVARVEHLGPELLVGCRLDAPLVSVTDTPGVEGPGEPTATLLARLPSNHPVRPGDPIELVVDVRQLSFFDSHTGEALWHPG